MLGDGNRYFSSAVLGKDLSTMAITSARLYGLPFFCPTTFKMGQIDIYVSSGSGSVHLGIYEDNGQCAPGKLLYDSGAVDASSSGVKGVTVTKSLRGGKLYWLALLANSTPTLRAAPWATSVNNLLSTFFGHSSSLESNFRWALYRSQSYGALPDPFGGSLTIGTDTPLIFLRKDNLF